MEPGSLRSTEPISTRIGKAADKSSWKKKKRAKRLKNLIKDGAIFISSSLHVNLDPARINNINFPAGAGKASAHIVASQSYSSEDLAEKKKTYLALN